MTTITSETVACYDHPFLSMDAWGDVEYKRLRGEGPQASLVCRFACALANACPFKDGRDIIANGGGWYGADGTFIKPPDDMLERKQAAAFLGVKEGTFNSIARMHGVLAIRGPAHNYYVPLDAVFKLAERYGPKHGTVSRYQLHLLRGEVPCRSCAHARNMEVKQGASLL